MQKIIIISANSDIGLNISKKFLYKNYSIVGTFRKKDTNYQLLKELKVNLKRLDLKSKVSIKNFINFINKYHQDWNKIVFCNGDLNPIEKFSKLKFESFLNSLQINCLSNLEIINGLIKNNLKKKDILLFAGGGTNNAVKYYSSYVLSKIFLIKFVEILDFEEKNINICILGPGWINTKIHKATIESSITKLPNKKKTKMILKRNDTKKFDKLNDCISWIFSNMNILSGRNLSLDYDNWGDNNLLKRLDKNSNLFKLRRFGNQNLK